MPFKDLIADSQDQRLTCKWCVIVGAELTKLGDKLKGFEILVVN
jgi:hypothetical protein